MPKEYNTIPRNTYAKLIFGGTLLLMLYRLHATQFLFFIYHQPIKDPTADYTFWLSLCLYFPQFIINHLWACLFIDIAVVVVLLAALFSAKNRHLYARLFLFFFFIQRITLETFSCSHVKSVTCIFAAILPFCVKDDETFDLLVDFGRYLLAYILLSAAYHKFTNGALFASNNFAHQLVNQHIDLATLYPTHISYKIAAYLITHPLLATIMYKLLFLSQVVFVTAFFTKKFDKILFVFVFAFAVNTYFIMRIYNFDLALLSMCLFYFKAKNKTS